MSALPTYKGMAGKELPVNKALDREEPGVDVRTIPHHDAVLVRCNSTAESENLFTTKVKHLTPETKVSFSHELLSESIPCSAITPNTAFVAATRSRHQHAATQTTGRKSSLPPRPRRNLRCGNRHPPRKITPRPRPFNYLSFINEATVTSRLRSFKPRQTTKQLQQ